MTFKRSLKCQAIKHFRCEAAVNAIARIFNAQECVNSEISRKFLLVDEDVEIHRIKKESVCSFLNVQTTFINLYQQYEYRKIFKDIVCTLKTKQCNPEKI
jgi:hypothetical protein